MCCEECHRYERCKKEFILKDNCCPKCQDYSDCVGMDDRDTDTDRQGENDNDNEDFF